MFKYEGLECPICHARFFDDDEIVVCPDCGAPHHKSCWKIKNKCAFDIDHNTPQQWTMPTVNTQESSVDEINKSPTPQQNDEKKSLLDKLDNLDDDKFSTFEEQQEKMLKMQVERINGVNEDEEIDGVDTASIAAFVGYNAARYLKVFKEMAFTGVKTGWNWIAFLFPQYWLLGRKCYKAGAITAAYSLFSTLMISIMQGTNDSLTSSLTKAYETPSLFLQDPLLLTYIGLLVGSLIIRIIIGLFGDYIYKKVVFSGINAVREREDSSMIDLFKKGGVNLLIPIMVYFAINFIAVIVLTFLG